MRLKQHHFLMYRPNMYCLIITPLLFAGANSVSVVERTRENLTCFMRVATSLGRGSWSKLTDYTMHVVNHRESLFCVLFWICVHNET